VRYGRCPADEITLVPCPLRQSVEVWHTIRSGTQRAFDGMAAHRIKSVVIGGTKAGGRADNAAANYRDALARVGRDGVVLRGAEYVWPRLTRSLREPRVYLNGNSW